MELNKSNFIKNSIYVWLLGVVAIIAGAWMYADTKLKAREELIKSELKSVASNKSAELSDAFEKIYTGIESIAKSDSLLAFTAAGGVVDETSPESINNQAIIKSFLESSAIRSGIASPTANPSTQMTAGIAVLNKDGAVIASSRGMASPPQNVVSKILNFKPVNDVPNGIKRTADTGLEQKSSQRIISGIEKGDSGQAYISLAVPFYTTDEKIPAGYVMATKTFDRYLFSNIKNFVRPILVIKDSEFSEFYEAESMDRVAGFGELITLIEHKEVSSSDIIGSYNPVNATTGMMGIASISSYGAIRSEIIKNMMYNASLVLMAWLATGLGLLAYAKHIAMLSTSKQTSEYREMMESLHDKAELFRLISASSPEPLMVLDGATRIIHANTSFANKYSVSVRHVSGEKISDVLPADVAAVYSGNIAKAMHEGKAQYTTSQSITDNRLKSIRTSFIPLSSGADSSSSSKVLVLEEDVTQVIQEREKRERTQRQMVDALISIMDSRDPYSAHHSARVSELSKNIATRMKLTDVEIETAELSGRMMNIGKTLIADNVLTSPNVISMKDLKDIRAAIIASANLLDGIEFNGPVVETIRQSQERVDGSGPRAITAARILTTAKIIAVANSYVAMSSNRAHRMAMSPQEAAHAILQEVGSVYDKSVVDELLKIVEERTRFRNQISAVS